MNSLIRRVAGLHEHEAPGGKLFQHVVVYLRPEQTGEGEPGCACGKCVFFADATSECLLTDPPRCDAKHGVCSLFLGRPKGGADVQSSPLKLVSKKDAGYIEDGPTMCGSCEYYNGTKNDTGECEKVTNPVYKFGCCSMWERA